MSSKVLIIAAALVCVLCTVSQTRADSPHAAINPHTWVMAGISTGDTLLVLRRSIRRSGHIYDIVYSDNGYQDGDGIWQPDGNLFREEIDCKYHTSHDICSKPIGGGLYGEAAGRWDTITSDSDEAVLERYLCAPARKGKR